MKKLTFAVLGMGNRGTAYAGKQLKYPDEMEITAMADTRRIRLDAANKYLHLPEDRLFDSAITLLDRSAQSHYLAFAAEQSRLEGGKLIHMDEYTKTL